MALVNLNKRRPLGAQLGLGNLADRLAKDKRERTSDEAAKVSLESANINLQRQQLAHVQEQEARTRSNNVGSFIEDFQSKGGDLDAISTTDSSKLDGYGKIEAMGYMADMIGKKRALNDTIAIDTERSMQADLIDNNVPLSEIPTYIDNWKKESGRNFSDTETIALLEAGKTYAERMKAQEVNRVGYENALLDRQIQELGQLETRLATAETPEQEAAIYSDYYSYKNQLERSFGGGGIQMELDEAAFLSGDKDAVKVLHYDAEGSVVKEDRGTVPTRENLTLRMNDMKSTLKPQNELDKRDVERMRSVDEFNARATEKGVRELVTFESGAKLFAFDQMVSEPGNRAAYPQRVWTTLDGKPVDRELIQFDKIKNYEKEWGPISIEETKRDVREQTVKQLSTKEDMIIMDSLYQTLYDPNIPDDDPAKADAALELKNMMDTTMKSQQALDLYAYNFAVAEAMMKSDAPQTTIGRNEREVGNKSFDKMSKIISNMQIGDQQKRQMLRKEMDDIVRNYATHDSNVNVIDVQTQVMQNLYHSLTQRQWNEYVAPVFKRESSQFKENVKKTGKPSKSTMGEVGKAITSTGSSLKQALTGKKNIPAIKQSKLIDTNVDTSDLNKVKTAGKKVVDMALTPGRKLGSLAADKNLLPKGTPRASEEELKRNLGIGR